MATISAALAIALEHHQAGRLDAAEEIYRRILAVEPNHAAVWHYLGVLAHQAGRHEMAVDYIRRVRIELDASAAAFHSNLAQAYRALGQMSAALACCRRALELQPDYAEAQYNLGTILQEQGNLDAAVSSYRRVLETRPTYVPACNNLGVALKELGKPDEASAAFRRALALSSGDAEVFGNLGGAYLDLGRLDEAVACCRRATELQPDSARAHSNLGQALKDQGMLDEAVASCRQALKLQPDFAEAHSNLLLALQYCADVTPAALAAAHAEYDRRHAASLRAAVGPFVNVRDAGRRLRLGFVSPDLGRHPVGYFLSRVVEHIRPEQYEMNFYSDRIIPDDLTSRLQAAAAQWRDVHGMSDELLAERIRADRIDILFDLAGHTAHHRLLALARKPAPLQITWVGYEGTTGLSAMDYLLADRYLVPLGAEHDYRERVLRLPEGYVCYEPPAAAPPVGPLPASAPGAVTFGSFNNPAKINPQVVAVWADILRRLPQARLVLKYRGMNDASIQQRYQDLFADGGGEPRQLTLLPPSTYWDYLAAYQQIDLALDPFPFSGSATTCEALWMGVPVVTCPGDTFASRHSLSHLSNAGLTETIARDREEYVEIAVGLAHDLPRLAAIRARLRPQMAASPLCDGKRFADNLMHLLREVWGRWCAGEK